MSTMKSKLASDLDRFRQATEKTVGKERQKHVQGTGRLMQEQESLKQEQSNLANIDVDGVSISPGTTFVGDIETVFHREDGSLVVFANGRQGGTVRMILGV